MFNLYGNERLTEWRRFRDSLESCSDPLTRVAELWATAPFVNPYLDSKNPNEWPDPWHLVLDSKLDELAISLGMLYTIKLTQRFIKTKCEIHKLMIPGKNEAAYILIVDDTYVLNHACRTVSAIEEIKHLDANIIWQQ